MSHFEFSTDDTLMAKQVRLEADMVCIGAKTYLDRVLKAKDKGQEAGTAYGRQLTAHHITPLAEHMAAFVTAHVEGRASRGRPHVALQYLSMFEDIRVPALITIRGVMDGISTKQALNKVARTIGNLLEDEVRFADLAKKSPGFWKWLNESTKLSNDYHKARVFRVAHREARETTEFSWSDNHKLLLGIKCIDLMIEKTGLCEVEKWVVGKNKTVNYVVATEETMRWIDGKNDHEMGVRPFYMPTVVPPKPWTTAVDGGYLTPAVRRFTLVKTRSRNFIAELETRSEQLQPVFDAINALQDTAWRINEPVYRVLRDAWEQQLQIADLPPRLTPDFPACPFPRELRVADMTEKQKEQFQQWKEAKHQAHREDVANRSRRIQVSKMLNVAELFLGEDAIYFPHQYDFRGRVYPIPMFLQPQGDDVAKGLLTFANGAPITDEEQADWLAIHGANVWGNDKVNLQARAMWAHANTERVLAVVADPLQERWWLGADKPWQFLAWCYEWAGFIEEGYGFVSSLPIALDGSCNGLQHFSAMLQDAEGGKSVNLVPQEKPADIYQDVADRTIAKLQASNDELAKKWLSWGITRKDTKRSVMIVPYSGTKMGCRKYVEARIVERLKAGEPNIWGETKTDRFHASQFLTNLIWESINETVVAARAAMDWLQKIASLLAKQNLPVNWRTPDGFIVSQAYYDFTSRRIETTLGHSITAPKKRFTLKIHEPMDKLRSRKQASGISPNFIHSLDATALRMTVNHAKREGMKSFAMIHDSYGTVAANTSRLGEILREEFVNLYGGRDVLADFLAQVGVVLEDEDIPPLPPKGTLDINEVLKAAFFFA